MGSTRFSFLIILALVVVYQVSYGITNSQAEEMKSKYSNIDEIRAWASSAFIGGYETQVFCVREKQVVVVIGQPTSGLVTSEVYVFSGCLGRELDLILYRTRLMGIADAMLVDESIELGVRDREGHDIVFLVIPAAGM